MKPHVLSRLPKEDVDLFWKLWIGIRNLTDDLGLGLDDKNQDVELSCHILARAVANIFPTLRVADGTLLHFNHSWLITPSGHIIDIYPVAIYGGPLMMDGDHCSPARYLYIEGDAKTNLRRYGDLFKKSWFKKAVGITTKALRKALKVETCDDIEISVMVELSRETSEFEPLFMGMSSH